MIIKPNVSPQNEFNSYIMANLRGDNTKRHILVDKDQKNAVKNLWDNYYD